MDKVIRLLLFFILIIVQGCSSLSKEQKIISHAIDVHGGELYERARIDFNFRDIHYSILKTPTRYEYVREFTDSLGAKVVDELDNDGFVRMVDGVTVEVTDERKQAYSNSINSVAYFAFLPYGLNDPAVQRKWIRETELEGAVYDVIEVNFKEEGGGEDFEDEFIYWINQANGQMDYLAYSYHTDGGGVRFRKAVNSRMVDGIRIQDYENYMPADRTTPVSNMEQLFKAGQLELLSEIKIENVLVEIIK